VIERNVYEYVGNTYFNICQGRTVVEIGPFNGEFTEQILQHNPTSVVAIEASLPAVLKVERKFKTDTRVKTIHGDMHYDLGQVGKVDVAVALGVIYHSHAPLFFLEELVNCCSPEVVLLDMPGSSPGWGVECQREEPNISGMRFTTADKRTCNIVIQLHVETIVEAMRNLGYGVARADAYPYDVNIKGGVPIFQFEKVST